MKVPKSLVFPLSISQEDSRSIVVRDAREYYVFELYSSVSDIKKKDHKAVRWIVKTLNKAANDF